MLCFALQLRKLVRKGKAAQRDRIFLSTLLQDTLENVTRVSEVSLPSTTSNSTSSITQFPQGEGYINRATGRRELHGSSGSLRVRKDSLEWAIAGFLEPTQSPIHSREQLDKAVTCLEEAVEEGVFPSLISISILLRRTTRDTDASFATRVIAAADVAGMSLDGRQLGWAISGAASNRDHAAFHSLLRKVSEFPGPIPSSILSRTIAGYFSLGLRDRAFQQLDKARDAGIHLPGMLPSIIDETLRSFPREPPTQRLYTALEGCESRFEATISRQLRSGITLSAIANQQNSIRLASELIQAREAVTNRRTQMQIAALTTLDALESLIVHYATTNLNITISSNEIDSLLSLLTGSLSPEGGISHHQSFGPGSQSTHNINAGNSSTTSSVINDGTTISSQHLRTFYSLLPPHTSQTPGLQMWLSPSAFRELNDESPTRRQLLTLLSRALSSTRIVSCASPRALSRCLAFILQNFKQSASFALGASPFDDAISELDNNRSLNDGPIYFSTLDEISQGFVDSSRTEINIEQIWTLETLSSTFLKQNGKYFGFANLDASSFQIAWVPEQGMSTAEIASRYLTLIAGLYQVLAKVDAGTCPPTSAHHVLLPWAAHERVLSVLLAKNRIVAAAQVAGHIAQARGLQMIQSNDSLGPSLPTVLQSHSAIADPFLVERLVAAMRTVFAKSAKTFDDLLKIDTRLAMLVQRILRPEYSKSFVEVATNTTHAHMEAAVIVTNKTGINSSHISSLPQVVSLKMETRKDESIYLSEKSNAPTIKDSVKFIWPQTDQDEATRTQGATTQLIRPISNSLGDAALITSNVSQLLRATVLQISKNSPLMNSALIDILQSSYLSREAIVATHSLFCITLQAFPSSTLTFSNQKMDNESANEQNLDLPQVFIDALYNKVSSVRALSSQSQGNQNTAGSFNTLSIQSPPTVSSSLGVASASSANVLLSTSQSRQLKDAILLRSLVYASRNGIRLYRDLHYLEFIKKIFL